MPNMPNDDHQPATKGDILQVRTEIAEMKESLTESMRDMQTEVLRAFYDWARPVDLKLKAIPPLDERLGLLEERVSKLERGERHPQ
jgi:hypothetical protein